MTSSEALEEIVDIDSTGDEDDEGTASEALLKFPEEPVLVNVGSTGVERPHILISHHHWRSLGRNCCKVTLLLQNALTWFLHQWN